MNSTFKWGCGSLVGLFLLFFAMVSPPFLISLVTFPPVMIFFTLLAGWISFLSDMLSRIHFNLATTVLGVGTLVLFLVGLHWLLRSTMERASVRQHKRDLAECQTAEPIDAAADTIGDSAHWRLRWTFGIVAGVVVAFAAGLCAVGIAHQTAWLVQSPDSVWKFDDRSGYRGRQPSKQRLKQMGAGFKQFEAQYGRLPPPVAFNAPREVSRAENDAAAPDSRLAGDAAYFTRSDEGYIRTHGWQTHLLPFVGHAALHSQVRFDRSWHHAVNQAALSTNVETFLNPAHEETADSRGYSLSHYAGNVRVLARPGIALKTIPDGTSHTILAGDVKTRFRPWGRPGNWRDPALGINKSPDGFGSPWTGGCHILLGDGSVRFTNENIDPKVLKALATPDGGEAVADW